jgi:hypothetical protein
LLLIHATWHSRIFAAVSTLPAQVVVQQGRAGKAQLDLLFFLGFLDLALDR